MGCYGICMWLCGEKCFLYCWQVLESREERVLVLSERLGDSTEHRRWVSETGRLSVYVIAVWHGCRAQTHNSYLVCCCLQDGMRHVCDECGRSYSRAANLDRHKAEVHNGENGRRRHRCRRCGRDFASRGRLVDHVCREQRRLQPRVLVRDRNYDDDTFNAHPRTLRTSTKCTTQTGPQLG